MVDLLPLCFQHACGSSAGTLKSFSVQKPAVLNWLSVAL